MRLRKGGQLMPAKQLVRASLPVVECEPPAGTQVGSLDDLEAILRTIEARKGSPVLRTHPGLVARERIGN